MPLNLGYVISSYGIWVGVFIAYVIWLKLRTRKDHQQLQQLKERKTS